MKILLSILMLLFFSMPILAEQYGAGTGAQPADTGVKTDALPATPQNIKVNITPQTLDLNWENSSEQRDKVTGYEIARANNYSGPYAKIATVPKGLKRYVDAMVTPEVVYFYKVRAVSGDRYSSYTDAVTGEIPLPGFEKGRK